MTRMMAPFSVGWSMISNMVRSFFLSQDGAMGCVQQRGDATDA
jgi:hypothetical protein